MSPDRELPDDDPSEVSDELGIQATYKDYFLQYASYVITDRAIPDSSDGLKPVQRRILHSLWENEDGRYNKVANIVGHSMKYHPHGDASIYAALVGLGQKELLIDTQGNWGNPVTSDPAAAARYIEARLSKFALEVVFAPHLTRYKLSYDGRNQEPIVLPVRFPLLLALGAEGIAVGLTTRILPHNFIELLEAQCAYLKKQDFQLFPDFPTGGSADIENYEDGRPGSRIKVRAKLEPTNGKSLVIREIPYGTTTESLIDSIIAANDRGKIKIAHVEDNSAAELEIVVTFQRGVDMENAMDALYAFTACEVTLTSNCMVIKDGRPLSLSVSELLIDNANQTRALLKEDLEIQLERLERQWHLRSLVQIFIENRIYLKIEQCETWESVLSEIDDGLEPHKSKLRRAVSRDDLIYLTEIKIRRISAWDAEKAREELKEIDASLAQVRRSLRKITQYTIDYLQHLIEAYGSGLERRTRLTSFDTVKAVSVVARTEKLYVDFAGGFIGTDSKIGQEIGPCADLDDVMVVLEDGGLIVTRVAQKKYVGEKILHAQIYRPRNRDTVFNLVYENPPSAAYVKRFTVGGITRDRRYELGGKKETRILHFSVESGHYVYVRLRKKPRIKTDLYVRVDDHLVKGRGARGVILSRHKISSVTSISENVYCNRMDLTPTDLGSSEEQSPAAESHRPDPSPPAATREEAEQQPKPEDASRSGQKKLF